MMSQLGLMAGSGGHVQGFGLKAVGHFLCDGYQLPASSPMLEAFLLEEFKAMIVILSRRGQL